MWRLNPVRFFICVAIFFGTILACLTPPFQSPDEYNHFFRAYQLSQGDFLPQTLNENRLGGMLPSSLDALKNAFLSLKGNYGARVSEQDFQKAMTIRLRPESRQFTDFPNTAIYAPPAYLPQAIGIAVGRLFSDRVLLLFYASRLANLAVWIWLVALAIRQIAIYKWGIAALALLPASLAIAASGNADVITNGLAFWLIAAFFRTNSDVFSGSKMAALAVISWNKLVLLPLALLAGCAGFRRWCNWKMVVQKSWLPFVIAATIAGAWGMVAQKQFIPYDRYEPALRDQQTLNPGVDPARQLAYMQAHPLEFAGLVLRSGVRALPSTCAHMVGKFGWEKNYLPTWAMALLWLALIAVAGTEARHLTGAQRCWLGVILIFSVALWAITMYALWCPVAAPELDNWQGRYFIALAPLAMLMLGWSFLTRWRQTVESVAAIVLLVGNIVLVFSIYQRYYG